MIGNAGEHGRQVNPKDIGKLTRFLCSEDAGYISAFTFKPPVIFVVR